MNYICSKKYYRVLHAREAALNTRRNCVEDWIAWHAKLKAEENRVARMEEAALKLVTATTNAFSCNGKFDTLNNFKDIS